MFFAYFLSGLLPNSPRCCWHFWLGKIWAYHICERNEHKSMNVYKKSSKVLLQLKVDILVRLKNCIL